LMTQINNNKLLLITILITCFMFDLFNCSI
jgi:hypothetical protein